MNNGLTGKQFVVTGGTGFLGTAVVEQLLKAGAICCVSWIIEKERDRFKHADHVQLVRVDCCDQQQVDDLYGNLDELWGAIHVVGGFEMARLADTDAKAMRRMFELNTMSCFLCSRAAVAAMRQAGKGGRIVNVAARPAVSPAGGMVAYSTAKAAVGALTQALAEEVKRDNILVNAVMPSIMDTEANRQAMPAGEFESWPKVEQVARTMVYLASPDNELTSGALVPVFGRA